VTEKQRFDGRDARAHVADVCRGVISAHCKYVLLQWRGMMADKRRRRRRFY
jgi:hypothetical protein